MASAASARFRSLFELTAKLLARALPPPATRSAARFRKIRSQLWLYGLVVFVLAAYAWLATGGGLDVWPSYVSYHDLQADGFRQGKLSLPIEPAPQILHAKDPYDRVNSPYWLLDASYYRGKYYMYWGPAPALLLAVGKTVLGVHRYIGDGPIQLFHECLAFLCGALLIERLARRLFGGVPKALVALAILAFGTANPALHMVATPSTYHAAIVSAQAWLLAGLLFAFDAVWDTSPSRARTVRLLLAGSFWALALATRVTVGLAIAVFIVASAWAVALAARERRLHRFVTSGSLLAVPVVVAGCALLVYNKLRFDSFLDFGTNLMLSGMPHFRISTEYVLPNTYAYVFRPFEVSCRFPYVFQVWYEGVKAFPVGTVLPADYDVREPTVGWFWTIPLTWLAPFALWLAPRPIAMSARPTRAYVWCGVCFLALGSVTGLVEMGLFCTTMRYQGDVGFGLVLLSILGWWTLARHRFGRYAPGAITAIASVLAVATIGIGCALGYHGYNGIVEKLNPTLDAKLVSALSVCGNVPAEPIRYLP